jgi:hypothetical protein
LSTIISAPTPKSHKLLIRFVTFLGINTALLLVLAIIVALTAGSVSQLVNEAGSATSTLNSLTGLANGNPPAVSAPSTATGTAPATTVTPTAAQDAQFTQSLQLLPLTTTPDAAKAIALKACAYLSTNPATGNIGAFLVGLGGNPMDVGSIAEVGVQSYCPQNQAALTKLTQSLGGLTSLLGG